MTHWLLTQVYPRALNAAVYTLTSGVVATLILAPFRSIVKALWRAVKSLDPETDYGVTKQLAELKDASEKPEAVKKIALVPTHRQ